MADPSSSRELVESTFGKGEHLVLSAWMSSVPPSRGHQYSVLPALPLMTLGHRLDGRRTRRAQTEMTGVELPEFGCLVLTNRQLHLWSATRNRLRRANWTIREHVLAIPRSEIQDFTNASSGNGWRTCVLSLDDGRSISLRVPAKKVAALVEAFAPENT